MAKRLKLVRIRKIFSWNDQELVQVVAEVGMDVPPMITVWREKTRRKEG
jgi:hypothetical protein